MFTYIDRVGVEMEGGWNKKTFSDVDIHNDVSVQRPPGVRATGHWGEVASEPMTSLSEVNRWIRSHIPDDVFNGNAGGRDWSCGFHIHTSFQRQRHYGYLADLKFFEHYHKQCAAWAKRIGLPKEDLLWPRLQGKNRFCRREFNASKQMHLIRKEDHERRTTINFCLAMHGTVEFRLFPQWTDADVCCSAVEFTTDCIEDYLSKVPKDKPRTARIRIREDAAVVARLREKIRFY